MTNNFLKNISILIGSLENQENKEALTLLIKHYLLNNILSNYVSKKEDLLENLTNKNKSKVLSILNQHEKISINEIYETLNKLFNDKEILEFFLNFWNSIKNLQPDNKVIYKLLDLSSKFKIEKTIKNEILKVRKIFRFEFTEFLLEKIDNPSLHFSDNELNMYATTILMLKIGNVDGHFRWEELDTIFQTLDKKYNIKSQDKDNILNIAKIGSIKFQTKDIAELILEINDKKETFQIIDLIWKTAWADKNITPSENQLINEISKAFKFDNELSKRIKNIANKKYEK